MAFDTGNTPREAFMRTLPKRCLKCHREGVMWKDVDLVCDEQGTTLSMYMVAVCTNYQDCGAVYAQQPKDGTRYGAGFKYCRNDVIFVDTLPYHISLGGAVSDILSSGRYQPLQGIPADIALEAVH